MIVFIFGEHSTIKPSISFSRKGNWDQRSQVILEDLKDILKDEDLEYWSENKPHT